MQTPNWCGFQEIKDRKSRSGGHLRCAGHRKPAWNGHLRHIVRKIEKLLFADAQPVGVCVSKCKINEK